MRRGLRIALGVLLVLALVGCVGAFVPRSGLLPGRVTVAPTVTPVSGVLPDATPSSLPKTPPTADRFVEAQVVEVVDGDTIRVLVGGEKVTVRYIGIDTPEMAGAVGQAARAQNVALVSGRTVRLERDVSDRDPYGRLLRVVWAGDLLVNAELVRLGYARAVAYPPDTAYRAQFAALQAEAEAARRGLWAIAAPTPAAGHAAVKIIALRRDGAIKPREPDEWVAITNEGPTAEDLTGWRLESERGAASGQVFMFPPGFVLRPGQICRVYTDEAHPEWCGLSFGYHKSGVWSNTEPDAAVLVDEAGAVVSRWE